jgi:UPF0042 nucleotide-binding protein
MSSARERLEPTPELVIITGLSGSGKGTVLRTLEDLGFYTVDNLPVTLIPTFADLLQQAPDIPRAALVVDVREGSALERFPAIYRDLAARIHSTLIFLEANEAAIQRRFSETRRPHPLGKGSVQRSIQEEKKRLEPIRTLAEPIIDTSTLTGNQLRKLIEERFRAGAQGQPMGITVMSFGYRNGVPSEADLVLDVRFLPNPNYVPELRKKSGRNPAVIEFMNAVPDTERFLKRIMELLEFLLPRYQTEGKRYLTIAFGCTGGHHRSVMIADEVRARLQKTGLTAKSAHRDIKKAY